MQIFYNIIALLGGLSMFLYGMQIMGDGLKSISGNAMKSALAKVTGNPALGFLLGVVVTCIIQSSTATIVLTVGLVGAGFLSFRQSVGVVLGANVGTAITAQIIRLMDVEAGSTSILYFFKADNLAPMALIIGIVLIMFIKKGASKNFGTIACGFGILFMGLIFMSDAVGEMGDSLSSLLTAFEGNYLLGFLAGVGVTGVIQSSSAVVGILQSFASTMGLKFNAVFAVIIGVNIGDCLTTFLVCRLGARPEQIRTTLVHIIYNICAAVLIIAVLSIGRLSGLLSDSFWNMTLSSGGVANVHGLFRLVPAVLLLPVSGKFAALAEKLCPDQPLDPEDQASEDRLRELDAHLLATPSLALDRAAELIGFMGDVAIHNFTAVQQQFDSFDSARQGRIKAREDSLDRMADAANRFIVDITPNVTLERDNQNQNFQIKALTCFERIGDHAINIEQNLINLGQSDKNFSDEAVAQLKVGFEAVSEILDLTVQAYKAQDPALAVCVEPLEEVIDELVEKLNAGHVDRMTRLRCDIFTGILYQNILQNLERISDQCSDLAIYTLEQHSPEIIGHEHEYIHNLHHSDNQAYLDHFHANYDRYFARLAAATAE